MGFKEENYTPKGLCICTILWMLITTSQLAAQSANHCPIRVDQEPTMIQQENPANSYSQNLFPFFRSWEDLNRMRLADDQFTTVSLDAYRRSTIMIGDGISNKIPTGAKIIGLELMIEGHTRGLGHVEGLVVQLTDDYGTRVGDNKALYALPEDADWAATTDSTDFRWRYGRDDDTWGINLTPEMINSPGFGYALQVRNKLGAPVDVLIDQITMIVYHVPLYQICSDHACVPFYTDGTDNEDITYEWYIPQGWELISDSEHDLAINIGPSYATFGTYEICVEAFDGTVSEGICCRRFNYEDCNPGEISGTIFLDQNGSFTSDMSDLALSEITVRLKDPAGSTVAVTTSDIDGDYAFEAFAGTYYIEVDVPSDSLVFVPALVGSSNTNSDITSTLSPISTDLIEVLSGQSVIDIDAILSRSLSIGDYVWEDLNGDGTQQIDEQGISGVIVTLNNPVTSTLQTATTDASGFYSFSRLASGFYDLLFATPDTYVPTVANAAANDVDSDNKNIPIPLSYLDGGVIDTIDAGFFQLGSIGDFVWEDIDMDGIQDMGEPGIADITIELVDTLGQVLSTTNTDSLGRYQFSNLAPGDYTVRLVDIGFLTLSDSDQTSDDLDSDGIVTNGDITTLPITLLSGEENNTVDFGLFVLPAEVSGFTFLDENYDGQYQNSEALLAGIPIALYDQDGTLVAETVSDMGGFYSFLDIIAGEYYLQYAIQDGLNYTLPNIGDDNSDSDVTGAFGIGTTDIISLLPGDISMSNAAGYFLLPSVGDYIWNDLNYDGLQNTGEPGINGITVELFDDSNQLVSTTTSTVHPITGADGFYLFASVDIGTYYLVFEAIDSLEYTVVTTSSPLLDSDITGVNGAGSTDLFELEANEVDLTIDAGYYQNGKIGDFVWEDVNQNGIQDEGEDGLAGVQVSLVLNTFTILATTTTDANGFYQFTDITPGTYGIRVEFVPRMTLSGTSNGSDPELDSDGIPLLNGFIIANNIVVNSGSCRNDIDFGFFDTPSRLGGLAWLDANNDGQYDENTELTIDGVSVRLVDLVGNEVDNTMTSEEGYYVFENVAPGQYHVVFAISDGQIFTMSNIGDDASDSDVTNALSSGSTDIITIVQGDQFSDVSAGYLTKPKVGDYIWLDSNRNGIQDATESGINGIAVALFDNSGVLIEVTTTTNHPETTESGYYLFDSLDAGAYYITFQQIDTLEYTIHNSDPLTTNSDITESIATGSTDIFILSGNDCNLEIDAGYILTKSDISGEVWVDNDLDGIQKADSEPLDNVAVTLFNALDQEVASTVTDSTGAYTFLQIDAGDYYIVFDIDERYVATLPGQGIDQATNSDIDDSNTPNSTATFTIALGQNLNDIDAGVVDGAVDIGGLVWIDENADGLIGMTEPAFDSVFVRLYLADGTLIDSIVQVVDGAYSFEKVEAGSYYVTFDLTGNPYINTAADQGDEEIDDDVTNAIVENSTDLIVADYFTAVPSVNAGYYQFASVGDMAFIDLNENGINDNEAGLNGVIVNLIDDMGSIIKSTITQPGGGLDSGYYNIDSIIPGDYRLQFVRPLFYQFIDADQGGDDTIDSDAIVESDIIATTAAFSLISGQYDDTRDAGFVFSIPTESSVSGVLWEDLNANGINDLGEPNQSLTTVILLDDGGSIVDMQLSQSDGTYLFDMLTEGTYKVRVILPQNITATASNIGDDAFDSDFFEATTGVETEEFFLSNFEDKVNVDLGILEKISIGNYVWDDLNNNGAQEANEVGIPSIPVTATNQLSGVEYFTDTDNDGIYLFEGLPGGSYIVCISTETNYTIGKKDATIDQLDSDANPNGCTDAITILSGSNLDIDFALTLNGSISGKAFVDLNGNGVSTSQEPGLENIAVTLFMADGTPIDDTTTSAVDAMEGSYTFLDVPAGEYYVQFDFPIEYIYSEGNSGPDDADSDVTGAFGIGTTDLFTVGSGQAVTNLDGGAYLPACIGNRVWDDANENGVQDVGEQGIEGIEVVIFRSFGIPFDTVYSNEEGIYKFSGLKQGLYFVQFVIPQEYTISPPDVGINDEVDSDADGTGKTPLISLAHGAVLTSVDCGIYISTASLRSVVWEDLNGDGMRQVTEARIPDIRITLYDTNDIVIGSTTTNALGLYAFQQIPAGEYKVFVDLNNTDYAFTEIDMSADDLLDSDIHPNGESSVFTSAAVLSVPNIDVGLLEMGGIQGIAWNDENLDGMYDLSEQRTDGVLVTLIDNEGLPISQQITGSQEESSFAFENLRPGAYHLEYQIAEDWNASMHNGITEMDNNSDIYFEAGTYRSPQFSVQSGSMVMYVDAGFYHVEGVMPEGLPTLSMVASESVESKTQEQTEGLDLDITVHPNPAKNYIRIRSNAGENAVITVLNAEKREVVIKQNYKPSDQIDLRHLHPGIYYITISQEGQMSTQKFIKIH